MPERILIGDSNDFPAGELKTVRANGQSIVVARLEDGLCALRNQCSHMPLPINGGKLEGNTITCPWHNSQFDMCDGKNLDWVRGVVGISLPKWSRSIMAMGKDPQPIPSYEVIEEDGKVYVQL